MLTPRIARYSRWAVFAGFLIIGGNLPAATIVAPILGAGEALSFRVSWRLFDKAGTIDIIADDYKPKPPINLHSTDSAAAESAPPVAGVPPGAATSVSADPSTMRRIQVSLASDGTIARLYTYRADGETFYDPATGRILSARYTSVARNKTEVRTLEFDRELGIARYRDERDPSRDEDLKVPEGHPLDFITCLVTARHWNLTPGQTHDILVQADKRFYPLRLRAERRETLRAALGEFDTLLVIPEPIGPPMGLFRRGGAIRVWIEDGPRALPLRIEIKTRAGLFVADLIRYQAPTNSSEPIRVLEETDVPKREHAPGARRGRRS